MRWPLHYPVFALLLALLFTALLSLTQGAMQLPQLHSLLAVFDRVFGSQYSQLEYYQQVVVLELRLPRLLLAAMVGAILAQCGAVSQGLFRNPLADPGIIGVSAGAAMGAITAIVWFPTALGVWTVPTSAFVFGLFTTLLVYKLAQNKTGTSVFVLLLAGVAITAFSGAVIGFISYFTDDQNLRELSLWQMGSLAGASSSSLWLAASVLFVLVIVFQRCVPTLNALLLGEAQARHLGIAVETMKLRLIILIAIGVGTSVASAGIIGFVGLVVPHLVRLLTGPNHQSLLPLCAICGALLLVVADLAARLMVTPAELPVGLVTALMGAPFFLILLFQQRKQWT